MTAQPVRVSYVTLLENSEEVQSHLKRAFSSEEGCLGIVVVQDLPEAFQALRIRLFYLAHALANQPEAVRESLSRPETKYSFGWSHGKEVMNGKPDTQKGSYYANPLLDVPVVSDQEKSNYPEYYAGNVWPQNIEGLEEFESTFKALGQIIFDVGCAIARACEPFVEISDSTRTSTVESLISSSKSNKARLLHYFAEPPKSDAERKETVANDALCGTHVDHSLLTGLCSAMYLSGDTAPQKVPPPSPTSGLYIYPRQSPAQTGRLPEALKVSIPEDCLAFQTGEALELLTGGKLAATPHFVSGSTGGSDTPVSRETFAFFLQPDVNDVIGPDGETFGGFTKRVLGRHYSEAVQEAED